MLDRRTMSSVSLASAGIGGGFLIVLLPMLIPKAVGSQPLTGAAAIAAFTASVFVGEVWGLGFASLVHRNTDEYQRERAKSAFYWGGTVGLVMSVPICAFIASGGLRLIDSALTFGRPLAMAFTLGYILPLICLGLGNLVARFWAPRAKLG